MISPSEGCFFYFAYGSNMLTERLQKRCSSASPLEGAVATADGYALSFSKRSKKDESGKATLVRPDRGIRPVHGVIFEIQNDELRCLDCAEGKGFGYDRLDSFKVRLLPDGSEIVTCTYLAQPESCDPTLQPYDWYRALVLAGAAQHGLPKEYVNCLQSVSIRRDPNRDRDTRREAKAVLEEAGFAQLLGRVQ